jgi:three-Cys-motif partner protein
MIAPFTTVLAGDIDGERVRACEARLRAAGAPAQGFIGPAVETIHQMVSVVPRGSLCFAYVDPYNLRHLSHSILKALAPPLRVDLAINFSTMDLIRNVDIESGPGRDGFDDVAPGWKEHVARQGTSRSGKWLEFFKYWVDLVRALGFEYSQEMPLIENQSGQGIYRMVFLANHDLPKRIWADVARGPNKSLDLL